MNRMNINVGGGSFSAGNIVQGDHNSGISGHVENHGVAALFGRFEASLPALAEPYEVPQSEVARLKEEVRRLKAAATAPQPDAKAGAGILKTIRENFTWAYPAVKDLVKAAWPAVLGLLIA